MTSRQGDFSISLLVPVIAIAYPIFDITFVSVTRYARGQSLAHHGVGKPQPQSATGTGKIVQAPPLGPKTPGPAGPGSQG